MSTLFTPLTLRSLEIPNRVWMSPLCIYSAAAEGPDILLLAEGLDVFKVSIPRSLAGKTLAESAIREETGCSVIAVDHDNRLLVNPDPGIELPLGAEMILIGNAEAEQLFLKRYVRS